MSPFDFLPATWDACHEFFWHQQNLKTTIGVRRMYIYLCYFIMYVAKKKECEKTSCLIVTFLLRISSMIHVDPIAVKTITARSRLPCSTLKGLPKELAYIVLITHGRPKPRKTLTLLLPKRKLKTYKINPNFVVTNSVKCN